MRLPGVGTDEDDDLGIFNIFSRMTILFAVKSPINPKPAGLLLRQSVVIILRPHSGAQTLSIRTAQMVPLSATSEESQRMAAITIAQVNQLGVNFGNGFVPGNFFKSAIIPTAQGSG